MKHWLLPRAQIDLIEIALYIARDNRKAADRLIDLIESKCALLGNNPQLGPERTDLGVPIRSFPVGRYLILYRHRSGGIDVVRVVHGSRNIPAMFRKS